MYHGYTTHSLTISQQCKDMINIHTELSNLSAMNSMWHSLSPSNRIWKALGPLFCTMNSSWVAFSLRVLCISTIPITPWKQISTKEVLFLLGRHRYWLFPYMSSPHLSLFDACITSCLLLGQTLTKTITVKKKRKKLWSFSQNGICLVLHAIYSFLS